MKSRYHPPFLLKQELKTTVKPVVAAVKSAFMLPAIKQSISILVQHAKEQEKNKNCVLQPTGKNIHNTGETNFKTAYNG